MARPRFARKQDCKRIIGNIRIARMLGGRLNYCVIVYVIRERERSTSLNILLLAFLEILLLLGFSIVALLDYWIDGCVDVNVFVDLLFRFQDLGAICRASNNPNTNQSNFINIKQHYIHKS